MADEKVRLDIIIGAIAKTGPGTSAVRAHMASIVAGAREATASIGQIGGKLAQIAKLAVAGTGVGAGAGLGLATMFVRAAEDAESLSARMQTAFGDAAAEWEAFARKVGKQTPFETSQVADTLTRLKNYGLRADEWVGPVGDWAAAMTRPIGDATEALADALRGEWERAQELGVTRGNLVAEGAHTNKQGQILTQTATDLDALRRAMRRVLDERFAGSMSKQMSTLSGVISNTADAWTDFKQAMGATLSPAFKSLLTDVQAVLGNLTARVRGSAESLSAWFSNAYQRIKTWVSNFATGAREGLAEAWQWISYFAENLANSLGLALGNGAEWGRFLGDSIATAFRVIYDLSETLKPTLGDVRSSMRSVGLTAEDISTKLEIATIYVDALAESVTRLAAAGQLIRDTLGYAMEAANSREMRGLGWVTAPVRAARDALRRVVERKAFGRELPTLRYGAPGALLEHATGADQHRGESIFDSGRRWRTRMGESAATFQTIRHEVAVTLPAEWRGSKTAVDLANDPRFAGGVLRVVFDAARAPQATV